jgi:hypothetical protein
LNPETPRAFRVFNVNTNELLELRASFAQLNFIVVSLLQGKYQEVSTKTDEEFLASCSGNAHAFPEVLMQGALPQGGSPANSYTE